MTRLQKWTKTEFLNVDLDISSSTSLQPLVDALGTSVDVLHAGRQGRRYSAHLELAGSGREKRADRVVLGLVALIKKLPRSARAHWSNARSRVFNVGIQASGEPSSFELPLSRESVAAIASVGGSIVITVYASARRV